MATNFSEVTDLALITIQDYKINALYTKSQSDWATFLAGYVARAVPLFNNSKIDLEYDLASQSFANTLGIAEINILANIINYIWLQREVNNLTQISNTMTPSDAKRYSEAENLKQKSEYMYKMREAYSQMMVDYEIKNFDWQSMANGDFF